MSEMLGIAGFATGDPNHFSITAGSDQLVKFQLPATIDKGSPAILSFVFRDVDVGEFFSIRIFVNGKTITNDLVHKNVHAALDRGVQYAFSAAAGNLNGGENDVTFHVQNQVDDGAVTISDVAIWFQIANIAMPAIFLDGNSGNIFAGAGVDANGNVSGAGADGDLVLRDGQGRDRIRLDANQADLWMGGNGAAGDIVLFPQNVGNTNPAVWASFHLSAGAASMIIRGTDKASAPDRIRLDANNANLWMGGNGKDGDIVLFPAEVQHGSDLAKASFHLDGEAATLSIGGSGASATSKNGKIVLRGKRKGFAPPGQETETVDRIVMQAESNSDATILVGGHGASGQMYLFKEATNNIPGMATIHLNGETGVITSLGGDCAEDFEIQDVGSAEPGTVMVIGSGSKLRISHEAYDRRVAGVVAGACDNRPGIILGRREGDKMSLPIALIGRVYCKVDADQSPIRVGDLLTTSSVPGYAMKAGDRTRAFGAVIGKALESLERGRRLIPVLVALQ
jgi:hypothetical protein